MIAVFLCFFPAHASADGIGGGKDTEGGKYANGGICIPAADFREL